MDTRWQTRVRFERRSCYSGGQASQSGDWTKAQAAVISQEGKFAQYLEGLTAGFIAQKNPPDICRGVPEDGWVVFDALSFNNYNDAATIVDDSAGWNGKSVRMGMKVDWNTSYTPPVRGKYRIVASLRCEGKIKEGTIGTWGVYDSQGKKSLKTMILSKKDFATADGSFDRTFRWIDLGRPRNSHKLLIRPPATCKHAGRRR